MPEDKYFSMLAAKALQSGYSNQNMSVNNNGWHVTTLHQEQYFIAIKIVKDGVEYYMLCHEGTQTVDHFMTDLNAINNKKRKKVKGKKGQILKEIWLEYQKYDTVYSDFVQEYSSKGTVLFAGHSLGGAVAGVAAAMHNVKSFLLAPIPFMVHKNWLNNYSSANRPVTYVNKSDPCVGDSCQGTQINWEISRHYAVTYISHGQWQNSHTIASFVDYFRNKTQNLC